MAQGGSYEREAVKQVTKGGYPVAEDARQNVFNYIEMFYNQVHRHGFNDDLSPVDFEKQYAMKV